MNSSDFSIDSNTGVISNVIELDYERQRWYSLVVLVSDQDPPHLQSRALVDIIVLDRNDEPPHFVPTAMNIKISEKAPKDMAVAILKAYDNDTEITGLMYGSADINTGHFSLDTSTGVVTLSTPIDLETTGNSLYVMNFYVYDGVNMSPQNFTLTVTVVDVNDNEPTFNKNEYVIYVPENTPLNTVIGGSFVATDRDGNALNSDRTFSLVKGIDSGNFTLSNNLRIVTNVLFDFEEIQEYSFMVQANNSVSEDHLTGRALVHVFVEDVNDNDPIPMSQNIYVNVTESTTVGSLIATIHATDADSTTNAQLSYDLIGNNTAFIINGYGEIRLASPLDRLVQEKHTMMVNVTDGGSPTRFAIVNVTVIVVAIPSNVQISNIRRGEVLENVPIGHSILTLNSTSRSGQVTYQLVANQDSTKFLVNTTTGELTTKGTFDYEVKYRLQLTLLAYYRLID